MRGTKTEGVSFDGAKWNVPAVPAQLGFLHRTPITVPRLWAEEAYKEYAAQYGTQQSFERLCERGGFGLTEIIALLVDRCERLEYGQLG